jgi:hypothetical protein
MVRRAVCLFYFECIFMVCPLLGAVQREFRRYPASTDRVSFEDPCHVVMQEERRRSKAAKQLEEQLDPDAVARHFMLPRDDEIRQTGTC